MLSNKIIDINADVGEGLGNESLLMPYLSSCNIACGGHAGDFGTMVKVVQLAKNYNVKIGAHPSFPDKANFGRLPMEISNSELFKSLQSQVQSLFDVVSNQNLKLNHIKPHGALYNLATVNDELAQIILDVIESFNVPIKLFAPYKSVISELALSRKIEVVFEAFADRNYNANLSLVSRKKTNALITKKETVLDRVLNMILEQKIIAINEEEVELKVDTICVHSDTQNAKQILEYLHQGLVSRGIKIN